MSVKEAWEYSEAQQKLEIEMSNEAGQITNRYIRGDERSFTIIAYPVPEIGGNYEEIFREEIVNEYSFAPAHMSRQRAAAVATLGALYYHQGRVETAAEHRPVYLRKSQAEREREERLHAAD